MAKTSPAQLEAARKWRAANPEKARESCRKWRAANREKHRAAVHRWREKNPMPTMEQRKANPHYAQNYLLNLARVRARKLGVACTISRDDINIPHTCPLLGIPLRFRDDGKRGSTPNSPSLDRIDPIKGYVPGNVWVISHKANSCKGSLTAEEIIRMGLALRQVTET